MVACTDKTSRIFQLIDTIAPFISASNEPGRRACTDIGRLPRGSNAPLLAAGYLTYH